jgi:hypothetical protein
MPYNTDEFRSAALEFIETGKYCKHDPNSISGKRFWIEQARRSVEGYNIGRDNIPGYYYWYLNFSPIMKAVATSDIKDDKVSGIVTLDFPDCWDGDYEYYHYLDEAENVGEHAVVLKTRRRGYSYKAGSMCSRNYFLLPGSKSFVYAHDKQYLTEADGILNKTWGMLDFVDTYTPFSKRRSINTIFHKRSGYKIKDNGVEVEAGFKSDIAGITLNDDWNKVRGKLAKLSLFEESGSNPHLLKAWSAMLPSMRQGNISLGLAIAFGTGGDDKGDNIMGLEELFTTPKGYSVHPVNNNWGQEDELSDETGWFVPEWQNYSGCMDKDGNSDKEKAMSIILKNRELVKNNSKNPDNYTRYIAEHPIFPYEALLKTSINDFPTKEIRRHISYIDSHDKLYKDMEFIGEFYFDENGKIMWKPSLDVTPIRVFPLRDIENIAGCWVIWEHPIRDNLGNIVSGRYLASSDPVDDDRDASLQSESIQSSFILDTWTDRIVAEYSGRPNDVEYYYEHLRRGLIYYNAIDNYEQQKKGLYTYFKNRNCLYLLADNLDILTDKNTASFKGQGNRSKGTMTSQFINKHADELIKTWLLKQAYGDEENVINLTKIRSYPLLKELLYYNPKGNFDRVSALRMLMLYRAEKYREIQSSKETRKSKLDGSIFGRNKPVFSYKKNTEIKKINELFKINT